MFAARIGMSNRHHDPWRRGSARDCPLGWSSPSADIMQKWTRGAHGNTPFGGNPVFAPLRSQPSISSSGNIAPMRSRVRGTNFRRRLRGFADKFAVVGEVRGKGLMIGVELVKAEEQGAGKKLCDAVITRAYHNGLILLSVRTEYGALHAAAGDR